MTISQKDIKKLWGLAAGRCSKPGCTDDCIRRLDADLTVIGEMAHIIAKRPDGPRGQPEGGDDTYNNLILLCPNHHTEIDKAPEGMFTAEEIHGWKSAHEKKIKYSLFSLKFESINELASSIKRLLIQNYQVWNAFGPDSAEAMANPTSNLVETWGLRKLSVIVPNNRKIINMITNNIELIDLNELELYCEFIEHAEGFERNCYAKTEGTLRFPKNFKEVINKHVIQ